jgi:hypothetical protein
MPRGMRLQSPLGSDYTGLRSTSSSLAVLNGILLRVSIAKLLLQALNLRRKTIDKLTIIGPIIPIVIEIAGSNRLNKDSQARQGIAQMMRANL